MTDSVETAWHSTCGILTAIHSYEMDMTNKMRVWIDEFMQSKGAEESHLRAIQALRPGRVAFFGTSSSPPHCGHEQIVKIMSQQTHHFDAIIVAPVLKHMFDAKAGSLVAVPFEDRMEMSRRAFCRDVAHISSASSSSSSSSSSAASVSASASASGATATATAAASKTKCPVFVLNIEELASMCNFACTPGHHHTTGDPPRVGTFYVLRFLALLLPFIKNFHLILGEDSASDLLRGKWAYPTLLLTTVRLHIMRRSVSPKLVEKPSLRLSLLPLTPCSSVSVSVAVSSPRHIPSPRGGCGGAGGSTSSSLGEAGIWASVLSSEIEGKEEEEEDQKQKQDVEIEGRKISGSEAETTQLGSADPREFIKKHAVPSVLNEKQQNFILDNFPPVLYTGESFIIKNASSTQIRNFIKENKAKTKAAADGDSSGCDVASIRELGVSPETAAAADAHLSRQLHGEEKEKGKEKEKEKIHEEVILSESVMQYILQRDLY